MRAAALRDIAMVALAGALAAPAWAQDVPTPVVTGASAPVTRAAPGGRSREIVGAEAALRALDLAEVERQRAAAAERGVDIDDGPLALVSDASRLMRCLPLVPLTSRGSPTWWGARSLLRLEALRLERHRGEGQYPADPDIERLKVLARPWANPQPRGAPDWVAWPLSDERWPGEAVEPALEPSACTRRPPPTPISGAAEEARVVEQLIAAGPDIPVKLRARVLLHGLARGARLSSTASVAAWLDDGEPDVVVAGALWLGRRAETLARADEAIALYRRALDVASRTDVEDGWARVRLVALVDEPHAVLDLARGARGARPQDAAALAHAEGRALYALGDFDGLERFGRAWLAHRGAPDPLGFDAATEDLLVTLALARPAERALTWTSALGPPSERDTRLDKLGLRAIETGRLDLAAYVYDELRREAEADRGRGGAPAVARLTRWLAGRARVEHARGDVDAFADLVGELVHIATDEADRPLARTAPHRAIAVLCQALLGPLTDAGDTPASRGFARTLVDGIDALTAQPTRWSRVLISHRAPLAKLAGVAPTPAKGKRPPPPIRSVGVVTLPRLEPVRPAPDVPPPLPVIGGFWVHPGEDGTWVAGPPWPAREDAAAASTQPRG